MCICSMKDTTFSDTSTERQLMTAIDGYEHKAQYPRMIESQDKPSLKVSIDEISTWDEIITYHMTIQA